MTTDNLFYHPNLDACFSSRLICQLNFMARSSENFEALTMLKHQ
jgi:hypothetical protein